MVLKLYKWVKICTQTWRVFAEPVTYCNHDCQHYNREAPEATGEEADDEDLEAPKIYEPVSSHNVMLWAHMISYDPRYHLIQNWKRNSPIICCSTMNL